MTEELAAEEFEEDVEAEEEEEKKTTTEELDEEDEEEETDNVGDPSVEINVEELIHELEADGLVSRIDKEKSTRKRLEELMEKKRSLRELEDFEDYKI
jgi:hypothetical protein